jgi:hypothetical protein
MSEQPRVWPVELSSLLNMLPMAECEQSRGAFTVVGGRVAEDPQDVAGLVDENRTLGRGAKRRYPPNDGIDCPFDGPELGRSPHYSK